MSRSPRLGISVLGPLAVRDGSGRDVTPAGALQRRLLTLLTLRRGDVVSADTAIDTLWPTDPPRDATAALQNHLFRLRRGLPPDLIDSVGSGYRLEPSLVDVDSDRVEALLAGDLDASGRAELAGLLGRWHGRAAPELEDTAAGLAAATRFDELHARAREALAAARLAAGEPTGLVAELTDLVDDHPLRERPVELLMRTLAADGRTADALRAYDDFRRRLGDELGIDPSPSLTALHAGLLAPAPSTSSAMPPPTVSRLPARTTELLGRDGLLAELHVLADTVRAVTLVGPGGVGKTSLLIALGHRLAAARSDRAVVLCELAQATLDTVADVAAAALGIDGRPGVDPIDRIADVLGDSEVVVLLDNCEHVLEPAARLAELVLTRCPRARVIATSRERLRIAGEYVRTVPTLLDDGDACAVELFVERAKAVDPAFGGGDEVRARVVEIVRRLDGLPLAIELAAARLHALDLTELAVGLDRPLALLADGSRTSPRHSSLYSVVAWSYGQLDDRLQQVFDAVSVFTRSFTVADAAAVCGFERQATADALTQLVERSLVLRAPQRRYSLLETLRAFGAERLTATGRRLRVSERHARWMVDWAEDARRRMHQPGEAVLAEVDDAVPELRAALDWLLAHQLVTHAGRMLAALINWAFLRLRPDVMAWAERVIAADAPRPAGSQVWTAAAYHAWMAGDMPAADQRARRAVELAAAEPGGITQTVATMRGNVDLFAGRLDEAVRWYEQAIDAAGDDIGGRIDAAGALLLAVGYAGDPRAAELAERLLAEFGAAETAPSAYLWYCAGEAAMPVDAELARRRFARAINLATRTNASFARGFAGASLASMEARDGDPAAAATEYRWLIPHWLRSGMRSTQWTVLRSVVGLLDRLGYPREAAVLEGAVRSTAAGHQIFGADEVALRQVGDRLRAALGDDDYESARREGAQLDGTGAAELALRALGP